MTPQEAPAVLAPLQLWNGCASWRIVWPLEELGRRGYRVAYGSNESARISRLIAQADVVLLHRMAWLPGDQDKARAWVTLLHDDGKVLVADYDDDILSAPIVERIEGAGAYDKSAHDLDVERLARIASLQLCDGVTVSTPGMAAVIRGYTDAPVLVVPNCIDLPRFRAGLEGWTRTVPSPSIGWAGGYRPDRDAAELATAWTRIAARFPDVTFVVAGYPLQPLCVAVPPERLVRLPWLPLETYARSFAEIDIGCCTLTDEPFNQAKSPIKAMEFAAAGAAVVASPTVYGDFLTDGNDGYLARDADDWTDGLAMLLEHPDARAFLARNLREWVEREHSLAANVERWPEAWLQILAHASAARDAEVIAFA